MKKIFYFVLIIICFECYSQQNYLPYFQLKNKAELAICREQYQKALDYYKQAFCIVDFPLGKEVYNAYICAAIVHDTACLYEEFSKYAGRVNFDQFTKKDVFQPYIHTRQWDSLVEKAKILREKYLKSINKQYVYILDSLNIEDQKPRKKKHPLKMRNIVKRENALKYWNTIDSCIALALDTLISKYDYPNERNTSYKYTIMPAICIWHRSDSGFMKLEYRAFCEGKIEPEIYAWKQDYIANVFGYKSRYCERFFPFPSDIAKLEIVNENRTTIGLPTLDELKIMNNYIRNKNSHGFVFHINWLNSNRW